MLGSLLPWFDTLWATAFDGGSEKVAEDGARDAAPGTDWALVMRAVGAFVGILFAIVSFSQMRDSVGSCRPRTSWS